MTTSAFSTGDDVITRSISCHSVATSQDTLVAVYEIDRCVSWVQQAGLKMVLN